MTVDEYRLIYYALCALRWCNITWWIFFIRVIFYKSTACLWDFYIKWIFSGTIKVNINAVRALSPRTKVWYYKFYPICTCIFICNVQYGIFKTFCNSQLNTYLLIISHTTFSYTSLLSKLYFLNILYSNQIIFKGTQRRME